MKRVTQYLQIENNKAWLLANRGLFVLLKLKHMYSYEKLLVGNETWAAEKIAADPQYFERLSHLQTPEFLWIGCSDSRVPANEITGTQPGEIFVHRNVANLVVNTDVNLQEELEAIKDEELRNDRLVELNVQEQVYNLAKTTIIQRCWKKEQRPDLRGWVYGLKDGLIKPVYEMKAGTQIDALYEFDDL